MRLAIIKGMNTDFTSQADTSPAHIVLPPALTIETVGDVVATLLAAPLQAGGDCIIDATQTHMITTPGLQTLLALGRALATVRGQFFLRESDDTIRHAFEEAGIPIPYTGV